MTARKKIVAATLLLAVAAILVGVISQLLRSAVPDPIYQGRRLSYWLEFYKMPRGDPAREKADAAVRNAGTNAIPLLLRQMHAEHSDPKTKLKPLVEDFTRHIQACNGFEALGSTGESAVPELIRLYDSSHSDERRFTTIMALGYIGPGAKEAIPLIVRAATNSNIVIRAKALEALSQIHIPREVSVPILIRSLTDSNAFVQRSAVSSLGDFGSQARAAVPQLLELRKGASSAGPSSGLRIFVDEALRKIDPQAATEAGVQMINGRPTQ